MKSSFSFLYLCRVLYIFKKFHFKYSCFLQLKNVIIFLSYCSKLMHLIKTSPSKLPIVTSNVHSSFKHALSSSKKCDFLAVQNNFQCVVDYFYLLVSQGDELIKYGLLKSIKNILSCMNSKLCLCYVRNLWLFLYLPKVLILTSSLVLSYFFLGLYTYFNQFTFSSVYECSVPFEVLFVIFQFNDGF